MIAGLSLVITVGWNFLNRRHTDQVAREIRSESFDLEQWKETRTEITRALREFEDAASGIGLLSRGGHSAEQLLTELDRENMKLAQKHVALTRELDRAAFQPSWVVYAYGGVVAGESDWDRLNSVLIDVTGLADADTIRRELKAVGDYAHEIAETINEIIRKRTRELHPASGQLRQTKGSYRSRRW